jgi:hypothetical protein
MDPDPTPDPTPFFTQGWKKPWFFFKPSPVGFLGFLNIPVFAQKREFLGFF